MSKPCSSIDAQALAVWHVDILPYKQRKCEMGINEFCEAIRAARVTLNLVAADKEIRALVEARLKEMARERELA